MSSLWGLPVIESELVPEGAVIVLNPGGLDLRPRLDLLMPSGRVLLIPLAARDRYGSPAKLTRLFHPVPGYTRHTLGDRELERDVRRARRGQRTYPRRRTA